MSNSDYKKPRTNIVELLPEVNRSNVNVSAFENIFNRFLTKPELETVAGTIGQRNYSAKNSNQLKEPSTHRQANQLQPLMYKNIATVDHITSYQDCLRELTRLGVDVERLPEWGATERFNFAPPINLDKLINFQDYYWFDPTNTTSVPQYVTIENSCSRITAQYNQRNLELSSLKSNNGSDSDITAKESEIGIIFDQLNAVCFECNPGFGTSGFDDVGNYTDYDPNNNDLFEIIQHNVSQDPTDPAVTIPVDWNGYGQATFNEAPWPGDDSIFPEPRGIYAYDLIQDCVPNPPSDWALENKWIHKADVTNISIAKQASGPIIEFNDTLELNEWSFVDYNWKYRQTYVDPWAAVTEQPSISELIAGDAEFLRSYQIFSIDSINDLIKIVGDISSVISIGSGITLMNETDGNSTYWTVESITIGTTDGYTHTEIKVVEDLNISDTVDLPIISFNGTNNTITVFGNRISTYGVGTYVLIDHGTELVSYTISGIAYDGTNSIISLAAPLSAVGNPVKLHDVYGILSPVSQTSFGANWRGFFEHWVFVDANESRPINNQILNPNTADVGVEEITIAPSSVVDLFELSMYDYLSGNNDIRVYLDGIQQYGTYQEGTLINGVFTAEYIPNNVCNAIKYFEPIITGDEETKTLIIETYAAVEEDILYERRYVRTVESDADYTSPSLQSLIHYRHIVQVKSEHHQYPLYNIYRVTGETAYKAEPLFEFVTDNTADVDDTTGLRLFKDNDGNTVFSHPLLEKDTESLLCFKDTKSVNVTNPTGLQTIWRSGLNNEQYVPRKENFQGLHNGDTFYDSEGVQQTVTLATGEGDWEIPDTWYSNPHHELRSTIAFDEIFPHFKSLIDAQQQPAGFIGTNADLYKTLDQVNWGLGGNILDHNGSFDSLYTSIFVDSSTPLTIIDFARIQYENNLNTLRDFFEENIIELMSDVGDAFMIDTHQAIAAKVIFEFETNDAASVIFGDAVTYDSDLKKGVRNWITTLPFIGIKRSFDPILLTDDKLAISDIVYHDGHINQTKLSPGALVNINTRIKNELDLVEGPTASRPSWPGITKGKYFNNTDTDILMRFTVLAVSKEAPSYLNPDGAFWLDDESGLLMVRDRNNINDWAEVNGIVGDIDAAWVIIDPTQLYTNLIIEVETRLKSLLNNDNDLKWNIQSDSILTAGDQIEFDLHMEGFFNDYVNDINNADPYASVYKSSDAFTWNYKNTLLTNINYPTTNASNNQIWGATWYEINNAIFNTSYPHLEPWKLQGFNEKPTWWDGVYKWTTDDTRKWNQIMWSDIGSGIVVGGELLPDGLTISAGTIGEVTTYSHMSVNTTESTTTDGYAPGDLLPPYWIPVTTSVEDLNVGNLVFTSQITDVINPTGVYAYGDNGPIEHNWKTSVRFFYDELKSSFRLQPAKFIDQNLCADTLQVAGLNIDIKQERVCDHKNMYFHGDIIDTNIVHKPSGINPWYVFYHGSRSFDLNLSDFRQMWNDWDMRLVYQTGTFFNTQTLLMSSEHFDITTGDYCIKTKTTIGERDFWFDSLNVEIVQVGEWNIGKNNAANWEFKINSPTPISRDVPYYKTNSFNCDVDVLTDTFTINELNRTAKWITGTIVYTSSSVGSPPSPLQERIQYFIIRVSDTVFKLAYTLQDAINDVAISINATGLGIININERVGIFDILGQQTIPVLFDHYVLDLSQVYTVSFPIKITGIQNVIDFIDGFVKGQEDNGMVYNDTSIQEIDEDTSRPVSWQVEVERFVDAFYQFGANLYNRPEGIQSAIASFNHELNPFRNNVWISHPQGVITDIIGNPFDDISVQQGTFDQYSRPITSGDVTIYREDNQSRITMKPGLSNDVNIKLFGDEDSYNFIHMAGAHIFLNTYEHIIMFDNYSVTQDLIYDPYVGLNHSKFDIQFDKQSGEPTLRPNVGGYFMRGETMLGNMEASVDGMKQYFDTFQVNESTDITKATRTLLGFESKEYFKSLDVTPKSEFLFWRGLIQQKGTDNAFTALANLKTVDELIVDEFWAHEVATFGDIKSKEYYELKVGPDDVIKQDIKWQFVDTESTDIRVVPTPAAVIDDVDLYWIIGGNNATSTNTQDDEFRYNATSSTITTAINITGNDNINANVIRYSPTLNELFIGRGEGGAVPISIRVYSRINISDIPTKSAYISIHGAGYLHTDTLYPNVTNRIKDIVISDDGNRMLVLAYDGNTSAVYVRNGPSWALMHDNIHSAEPVQYGSWSTTNSSLLTSSIIGAYLNLVRWDWNATSCEYEQADKIEYGNNVDSIFVEKIVRAEPLGEYDWFFSIEKRSAFSNTTISIFDLYVNGTLFGVTLPPMALTVAGDVVSNSIDVTTSASNDNAVAMYLCNTATGWEIRVATYNLVSKIWALVYTDIITVDDSVTNPRFTDTQLGKVQYSPDGNYITMAYQKDYGINDVSTFIMSTVDFSIIKTMEHTSVGNAPTLLETISPRLLNYDAVVDDTIGCNITVTNMWPTV